jgi:hypothetical protein
MLRWKLLAARRRSDARYLTRGQVIPIVALFMLVLIGFAALAIDYGTYLTARRNYQNYADAAALAGSSQLSRPVDGTRQAHARAAAWDTLQRQLGLTFGGGSAPTVDTGAAGYTTDGWTLWVDTPPTAAGGKYPGNAALSGSGSVFVRVERDNPAFLSRIFALNGRTIEAWATAGTAPSRWAVLALCPRNGTCPSPVESVTLAGTNTVLQVQDGDLGSNWGLKINSNAADRLQLLGDSDAYLVDTTCGPSRYLCYPSPNVSNGSGTSKLVKVLPAPVEDPNYPAPTWIDDATAVPWRGNANHDVTIAAGSGSVTNPAATNVGCDAASPHIGPGRYRDIDIKANSCVILDPTFGLSVGQQPGIFVITRNLNIGNSSFAIGDGDTVFWTNGANPFNPAGGIVLNNGNAGIAAIPAGASKYGAWTTMGNSPWSATSGTLATTWTTPPTSEVGIAFYVRKTLATITSIFNMSGTTPLMFLGILYAPQDNVGIAGSGLQAAVGQIISWTVTYNGNTTITQLFDGPADTKSYLIEPRTGQPD